MKKLLLALTLAAFPAQACDLSLQASNAWARPTMGASRQTAVYLDLKNEGEEAVELTGVSSPSGSAGLHESMQHEGMVHMQKMEAVRLAPGETVSFTPGHKHIMIENLKAPLKAGQQVKLTMYFKGDMSTTVTVPVSGKAVAGEAGMEHVHHHH